MVQLITELFAKHLGNEYLAQGNDGTVLPAGAGRLVASTDIDNTETPMPQSSPSVHEDPLIIGSPMIQGITHLP